ncbi:MAG: malto-oligosyltrehalose trehalohydrolase [Candidatus Melainabacteria bacterium GWF2_37_15]|nr:MAG: malto-oligosyltrehalose trehalohydrolase [Candidatus Melainabacteria bacterium GWF2_37_15]
MKTQVPKNFGPKFLSDGQIKFDLWAPDTDKVELCLENKELLMKRDKEGWFSICTNEAHVGSKYMFRINGDLKVPDPASKCQAVDVDGWSEVVKETYNWGNDSNWKGRPWHETVLYELHVGTFTEEGTFKAIEKKLDYFVELGVTAIELMPVADFPGKRNWGYDGVLMFAPDRTYGTPDDLKDLIKAAHEKGLMVFLDVVYNHFGPDGNYLYCYAKSGFFESKHTTPWGNAINFENRNVRDFYIENVLHWLEEYRFDGLRFDAVHEIKDDSPVNILEEIASVVKERIKDRHVHLVLENDDNIASLLHHYVAQWNDDFHHCVHIQITGEKGGYYEDYTDHTYYLARSLAEGFAFQGEISAYRGNTPRGENSRNLNVSSFVNFIQNHDQIGNRAFGERISALASEEAVKAAATLYLLAPTIPMVFMGEEWGCKTPFMFFCNLGADLSDSIRDGRRREFSRFPEFADPENRKKIPDPTTEATFISSKINWDNIDTEMMEFYKELLNIRKKNIVPLIPYIEHSRSTYEIKGTGHFTVKWFTNNGKILEITANFPENKVDWSINNG